MAAIIAAAAAAPPDGVRTLTPLIISPPDTPRFGVLASVDDDDDEDEEEEPIADAVVDDNGEEDAGALGDGNRWSTSTARGRVVWSTINNDRTSACAVDDIPFQRAPGY
jgi:hypothetical protein